VLLIYTIYQLNLP